MLNVSMTEAKRDLSHLVQQGQTFNLTKRGQDIATVRIFGAATFDADKAQAAAIAIAAIAAKMKPSKRNGATGIIRALRDA